MLMASRWILTKPQSTGDQVCQDPAAHIERLHDHSMASRVNQGHHLCLLPAASKRCTGSCHSQIMHLVPAAISRGWRMQARGHEA